MATWARGPAQATVAGYFAGKSDDSTFLSDPFFGNSMLLPNRDLDDGYQKVDVSGSYRFGQHLRWFVTVENLLNQRYATTFGFPNLPRTARGGITIDVGGGR